MESGKINRVEKRRFIMADYVGVNDLGQYGLNLYILIYLNNYI